MKTYIKNFYILLFFIIFVQNAFSSEKIKIGLIVPLSGEYSYIGSSIINSVHLAVNKIDSDKIEILPRDNNSNPNLTFKAAKDLYDNHNVRIIIGPIFKENNLYLNKLPDAIFIVDLSNESTAITEAQKLGIPVIGLADSNVDPEGVEIVIPGNDDAIRSIELITSAIADSCLKGSGKRSEVENKENE